MTPAWSARCALVVAVLLPATGAAQVSHGQVGQVSTVVAPGPRLDLRSFSPSTPSPNRLGIFTFEAPVVAGEFLRVRVPVGELMSKAAHGLAAANHRRRERAARRDVLRALDTFHSGSARPRD